MPNTVQMQCWYTTLDSFPYLLCLPFHTLSGFLKTLLSPNPLPPLSPASFCLPFHTLSCFFRIFLKPSLLNTR